MKQYLLYISLATFLACLAVAEQTPVQNTSQIPSAPGYKSSGTAADEKLNEIFQSKIKAEWEALKKKDQKAYGELLADDYEGVEIDGRGERTRMQAINEIADGNISDYTLWGFKLIPLCADTALVVYESTIRFPPKSAVRFSRVYITEIWIKRQGEWKELHYQETHVK
jgi:uncharacterized protein DUF4440